MTSTNVNNSSSSYTLACINLGAYVLNSLVVYGIGTGLAPAYFGYKGRDNASISHKYQTLVTPADGAFGIWGIIYTAQLLWALWLVRITRRDEARLTNAGATYRESDSSHRNTPHDKILHAVAYHYVDASVAQIAWTLLFAAEQMTLSAVAMVFILLSLFRAVHNMRKISDTDNGSNINYWIYKFPLTSHFGWILAATGLNLNVALLAWNLSSTTLFYAGLATLSVLLFQALYMTWNDFDWTVPLTIVWALIGIYLELLAPKSSISDTYNHRQIDAIQWTAQVGASLVAATLVARVLMTQVQKRRGGVGNVPHSQEEAAYLRADD